MLKKLINGEVVYTTQEEWDRYQKYIERQSEDSNLSYTYTGSGVCLSTDLTDYIFEKTRSMRVSG